MTRSLFLCVVLVLSGCALTKDYLNPEGKGRTYTVGNPCPYAYRVLEVRGTTDPELRVAVGSFRKGEYGLTKTTLFMAISDNVVAGYQVGRLYSPAMTKEHRVSFPGGTSVRVILPSGEVVEGNFSIENKGEPTKRATLLSFAISEKVLDEFTAFLPSVMVDGELFNLGEVHFKRATETWHVANC